MFFLSILLYALLHFSPSLGCFPDPESSNRTLRNYYFYEAKTVVMVRIQTENLEHVTSSFSIPQVYYQAKVLKVFKGCANPEEGPSLRRLILASSSHSLSCSIPLTIGEKYVMALDDTADILPGPDMPLLKSFFFTISSYVQVPSDIPAGDAIFLRRASRKAKFHCEYWGRRRVADSKQNGDRLCTWVIKTTPMSKISTHHLLYERQQRAHEKE